MTKRKEKPMMITDTDIERAILKNLAKLNLIQDTGVSLERDNDDSGDNADNGLID